MTTNDLKRMVATDSTPVTPNNFTRFDEESKIPGVLTAPQTAPATDALVAIGTDGKQESLALGGGLKIGGTASQKALEVIGIPYLTTAPTADNPNGLMFVVLAAEPATYYNGYYYIITEA